MDALNRTELTRKDGRPLAGTAKTRVQDYLAKIPYIKSIPIDIHKLKSFKLANMWAIFKIADFERITSEYHTDEIRTAIVNNKFYDPFVRGYIDKKGFNVIVDGQHRLAALWFLAKYYGLKEYDLNFLEYSEKDAREIYRGLNAGKPLNLKNILKSYDEGGHPFFIQLKDILSHDDNTRDWSFAESLSCLAFAKTGNKGLGKQTLKVMLEAVTDFDINFIREYTKALKMTMPTKQRGQQFRPAFIKPNFAAAYKYNLNFLEITNLIYFGLGRDEIEAHLDTNSKAAYVEITGLFVKGIPADKTSAS